MVRKLTMAVVLAAVASCGPEVLADENPAKTVGAYINNQTLFILHVRLDPKQVQEFMDKLAPFYAGEAAATQPAQTTVGRLKQACADISRLGVSEFYVVAPSNEDRTLIVPIAPAMDVAAVAKAFGFEQAFDPRGLSMREWKRAAHKPAYFLDGKFLLLGTNWGLADLKERAPAARDAFGDGFAALGDAPVRLVVAPTAPVIELLASHYETLPASLGKVQIKSLLGGVQWIAAAASVAPASLDVTVQARDEAAARAISAAVNEVLAAARKQAASGPSTLAAQSDLPTMLLEGLAPSLKLQAKGATLKLKLDDQQIGRFLDKTLPESLTAVRQGQKFEWAQIRIRAIAGAFKFYLAKHKEYPPDLQTLQNDLGVKDMFVHPVNPQITPGYIYIKPAEGAQKVLMVYENYPTFPALGVFAAFADGSTTLIASEEQFKKLVAEAKK